jgi:ABC-type transport system involved in cytochrome c biogenesis permease subunit
MVLRIEQWLIVVLYSAAFIAYAVAFRKEGKDSFANARWLLRGAVFAHLLHLLHLSISLHRLPVTDVFEAITLCVWLFAATYVSLEWRVPEKALGVFILPVIIILQMLSAIFLDYDRTLPPILENAIFEIHVFIMLLAYAAFAISFIASLLYLLLSREIEGKQLGLFYRRLPSLELFDSLSNRAVNVGLAMLTTGLIFGAYTGYRLGDQFSFSDPKVIAVVVSWLIYVLHIFSRTVRGWQGRRAALLSLVGFSWSMFSFLIVSQLFSKVHQF